MKNVLFIIEKRCKSSIFFELTNIFLKNRCLLIEWFNKIKNMLHHAGILMGKVDPVNFFIPPKPWKLLTGNFECCWFVDRKLQRDFR